MRIAIVIALIATIAGTGYYFGYLRNENVCYDKINNEIESTREILKDWGVNPPESMTKLRVAEMAFQVSQYSLQAFNIKNDPYKNICDFYFYGFSLKRK